MFVRFTFLASFCVFGFPLYWPWRIYASCFTRTGRLCPKQFRDQENVVLVVVLNPVVLVLILSSWSCFQSRGFGLDLERCNFIQSFIKRVFQRFLKGLLIGAPNPCSAAKRSVLDEIHAVCKPEHCEQCWMTDEVDDSHLIIRNVTDPSPSLNIVRTIIHLIWRLPLYVPNRNRQN